MQQFVSTTTELYKEGYGIISKKAMRDKNLSIEAKAIYSYMCSFAGAGATSFPGVALMLVELGISENRFYNHRKQLVENGYITIVKQRKENRADRNLYNIEGEPSKIIEKRKEEKLASEEKGKREIVVEEVEEVETVIEKSKENLLLNNIQVVSKLCQTTGFKLKNKDIEVLIDAFGLEKIYKAIATAISTKAFDDGQIKNFKGYLTKILMEQEKAKITNVNITNKKDKMKFNNYEQRDTDYDALEDELLGWD